MNWPARRPSAPGRCGKKPITIPAVSENLTATRSTRKTSPAPPSGAGTGAQRTRHQGGRPRPSTSPSTYAAPRQATGGRKAGVMRPAARRLTTRRRWRMPVKLTNFPRRLSRPTNWPTVHYRALEILGHGGMGAASRLVRKLALDMHGAASRRCFPLLAAGATANKRFLREAQSPPPSSTTMSAPTSTSARIGRPLRGHALRRRCLDQRLGGRESGCPTGPGTPHRPRNSRGVGAAHAPPARLHLHIKPGNIWLVGRARRTRFSLWLFFTSGRPDLTDENGATDRTPATHGP